MLLPYLWEPFPTLPFINPPLRQNNRRSCFRRNFGIPFEILVLLLQRGGGTLSVRRAEGLLSAPVDALKKTDDGNFGRDALVRAQVIR